LSDIAARHFDSLIERLAAIRDRQVEAIDRAASVCAPVVE
jgi:hypothetical protein